jgi:hypothetical protein
LNLRGPAIVLLIEPQLGPDAFHYTFHIGILARNVADDALTIFP